MLHFLDLRVLVLPKPVLALPAPIEKPVTE
jgi:hypothetical protein